MNQISKTIRRSGKQQRPWSMVIRLAPLLLLLFPLLGSSCGSGDLLSSTSSNSLDQSDHSQNGIQSCETICEPVDTSNCNDTQTAEEGSPTCFLVTQECSGPGGKNGPELMPIPPTDCVFNNPVTTSAEEDAL